MTTTTTIPRLLPFVPLVFAVIPLKQVLLFAKKLIL